MIVYIHYSIKLSIKLTLGQKKNNLIENTNRVCRTYMRQINESNNNDTATQIRLTKWESFPYNTRNEEP